MKYLIFIILLFFIKSQDNLPQHNITNQQRLQNTTVNNQNSTTNTISHQTHQTRSNQQIKTNQTQAKQQVLNLTKPQVITTTLQNNTKDALTTQPTGSTNTSQITTNKQQVKNETILNETIVNTTTNNITQTNSNNNQTNVNNNGTLQQEQIKSQQIQQQQHNQQNPNPQIHEQADNISKNQSNTKEQIKNNTQTNIKQNNNVNITIQLNHDDVVNVTTNSNNNTSHKQQTKQETHSIQIIQLAHNTEAILPEATPHFTQTIQTQVDGHSVNYERTQNDRMIEYQLSKTKQNARIDYQHMKDYAFIIKNIEVFYIKPDHDVDFMCQFNLYWQQNNSFVQSSYQKGQQVKVVVSENGMLIHSDEFYRAHGFTIRAKKGKMYALRIINKGYNKLITMISSNYVSQNQISGKINSDIANEHQLQIQKMKNTLRTFLGVTEKSMMINQQIAYNVTLHTKRYMSYQIVEMLLVIFGAVVQIYLVKRLLNPHSII